MAKIEKKEAEASTNPSSKTDRVQPTNFDKPADLNQVGKKSGRTPVPGGQPKPSTAMVPALTDEDRQVLRRLGAKALTGIQVERSVSISCPDNKAVDLALRQAAQGLVDEFAPADAVESTYAPVIVGIRNAVMTSLGLAAKGSVERRDVELNIALKGAGVLAQLLEAFDVHRGHGGRRFTVGNVNVESGAQAIVGNVKTTSRQETRTDDSSAEPNKRKPRAA